MNSLKLVQEEFQNAVLRGDAESVLKVIRDSGRENRQALFSVYQNAYVLRLIEFLKNDYEKLHIYMGDEMFEEMASAYAYAVPSNNPNGRWFGTKLPEFLSAADAYNDLVELSELAALERALNDVFDSTEMPVLTIEMLRDVPPDVWGTLVFDCQPATRVLYFTTNVVDIWSALHKDETPPEASRLTTGKQVLFYREARVSKFRPLSEEEYILWNEAAKGTSFSGLCEVCATYGGEADAAVRAASFLNGWIASGVLAAPNNKTDWTLKH